MRPLLRLLRPEQWVKNSFVLAAPLFALGDANQSATVALAGRAFLAAGLFCLLSSAVYVMNDLADAPRDRLHPVKKNRPIAAGQVSAVAAAALAALLFAAALAGAWRLGRAFFFVAAGYAAMQVAYTFGLKRVAVLDVAIIAAGFVLRAVAGAEATGVFVSKWLLICTFALASFLGFCKRRGEMVRTADGRTETRAALAGYTPRMLDGLITLSMGVTAAVYLEYTLYPATVAKFRTGWLWITFPFVALGLVRYWILVYRMGGGETPEKAVLRDLPLVGCIAGYLAALAAVFFLLR
jgi:4-hydroxybenzoate polyprenyltransferase